MEENDRSKEVESQGKVLFIDDDLSFIERLKVEIPSGLPVRVQVIPDLDLMPQPLIGESESGSSHVIYAVLAHSTPDPRFMRMLFETYRFRGVLTDLEIGGDSLGGLTILSIAATSPSHPKLGLFTGRMDEAVERLARSFGVEQIIMKQEGIQSALRLMLGWLDLLHPLESHGSRLQEGLRNELYKLKRENDRLRLGHTEELDSLRGQNRRLMTERRRLRREVLTLKREAKPIAKKGKQKDQPDLKRITELVERVNALENERQMILAHHHDLTNTSSLATQGLDHVCSDPKLIPPIVMEELQRARIAAKHCSILVLSLATLSGRASSGPSEPSSVEKSVADAFELVKSRVSPSIKIDLELPSRLPLCAVPENLLVRAVLNLLLNSLEAMPKGGRIVVGARLSTTKPKAILLQVRDSGIGVRKKDLSKVFDHEFSTKGKKHGFGLFIVRLIMTEHGGDVEFASQRGKGTVVTLKVPVA